MGTSIKKKVKPIFTLFSILLVCIMVFGTSHANGQTTGSISGTVYQGNSTSPVESLGPGSVIALSDPCGGSQLGMLYSIDGKGQFTIINIPPGDVYLKVNIGGVEYWYDNADSCEEAVPVTVNAGETVENIDFHLPLGTISGIVYQGSSANPVNYPMVDALSDPCGGSRIGILYSFSENGQYTIINIPPGHVYLKINIGGVEYWYDNADSCEKAFPVTVNAGETVENVNFHLPLGTISGTVYTSDGITAVNYPMVDALSDPCGGSRIGSLYSFSENGQYTITDIPAGDVYLKILFGDIGYWYSDADSCEEAIPVTVNAGETLENIDFHLPLGTISGTVYESDGITPVWCAGVIALSDPCGESALDAIWTDKNGNYTLSEVPQGDVYVKVEIGEEVSYNFVRAWYNNAFSCEEAYPVVVTAATETGGIDFQVDADTDTDDDGIPDQWEINYFGDIDYSNGTGDTDSDGIMDLAEFAAGTHPGIFSGQPNTDDDRADDEVGGSCFIATTTYDLGLSWLVFNLGIITTDLLLILICSVLFGPSCIRKKLIKK